MFLEEVKKSYPENDCTLTKLAEEPTEVIIDGGVGYHVNISLHTYSLLPKTDFIKLFTHLQVKEDSHTLFGFIEKSEREILDY
jgi:Holliday junction DNA helicase RuvA